ncbi:nucleoporin Nup186/Nup192/Nup205 [Abortiporus biennis]|nr:nucleoporin Nup186/Nup192/Nup205 [Abortiporus biennis]
MASLASFRTTLISTLKSQSSQHASSEQDLYEQLMAHKSTILSVFDVGGRNANQQKQLESGKINIRDQSLAVNADFAKQVIFISQQLDCSELYIAELLHGVMSQNPNLGLERWIEETILEFHARRRQAVDCLLYIVEAAYLAEDPGSPELYLRLDQFVRSHLLPASTSGTSLPLRLLKLNEAIGTLITQTLNAKQNAGSDTLFSQQQGGRLGSDILQARYDSLKYEQRGLAITLSYIGRMGYLAPQDIQKLVDWLHSNPRHALVNYMLQTVLGVFDPVPPSSIGGQARSRIIADKGLVGFMKQKLGPLTEWQEPGLKATLLLKWTLFLTEVRHRDPSLEDRDGFRSDELETQIWNAIQGDAFTFLTRSVVSLRSQESQTLPPLVVSLMARDTENRVDLPPDDFVLNILESYDLLIRSMIIHASSELRKIKQRQEDILHAHTRTDRSRNFRASSSSRGAPQEQTRTSEPRNDMAVLFTLLGMLYSSLPPDYALPFWGSVILPFRRQIYTDHPEDVANKLPGFLQWAVWSTQPGDINILTALYDMLHGLAKGQQCSELAYNFLVQRAGEGDSQRSLSGTQHVPVPAVSWSSMFGMMESWAAMASANRPTPPTNRPFGGDQNWDNQSSQAAAQASRLTISQPDVVLTQSFLRFLSTVVTFSVSARLSIFGHARFRAIPTLLSLVPLSIPLELKGAIFNALAAFCLPDVEHKGAEICKMIWTMMERQEVISVRGSATVVPSLPSVKGVEVELEEVESAHKVYPATIPFLKLLATLVYIPKSEFFNEEALDTLSSSIPENIGHPYRPIGIGPYVSFVIDNVFSKISRREYADPQDRWLMNDLCLRFVERCLASYRLELLVADPIAQAIPNEVVKQFTVHPGFDIMKRLLTASTLQTIILSYVVDGVDGLDKGIADEQPFYHFTMVRLLRIILRVLQIQDIFLDVLMPLVAELNDPLITDLHPTSYYTKMDQALSFEQNSIPSILAYVAFPQFPELAYLSLQIISSLSNSSTSRHLALMTSRSNDSARILDGLRNILEADCSVDCELAQATSQAATGPGGPDPGDKLDELRQGLRLALLDYLIQDTDQSQSYPTLAHYMLFGHIGDQDQIQDPHALGSRRSCIHALLDVLNSGIPRQPQDFRYSPLTVDSLLVTTPILAERCYHVVYQLCKHPKTSDFTLRYLRSREDFFTRHLLAMRFKAPTVPSESFIEVQYSDRSRVVTTVASFSTFLRSRSWLFEIASIELYVLAGKGLNRTITSLLDVLFGGDVTSSGSSQQGWGFDMQTFQDLGQSHVRIIEYLLSLDFDWSDSLAMPSVALEFLNQLNLQTCLRISDTGCTIIDKDALMLLLLDAKRDMVSQGRLLTQSHTQQLSDEMVYILGSCAVENHRRELLHAIASGYESWKSLMDVALARCFDALPLDTREAVLLELMHFLPDTLRRPHLQESTRVTLSQVLLTTITKLRRHIRENTTVLPPERFLTILRDLLDCLFDHRHYQLVRGNLYASLIQFFHLVLSADSVETIGTMKSIASDCESMLQGHMDTLISLVSRDAVDGPEVWRTVSFLLLDTLLQLPRATASNTLCSPGILSGFVQSLKDAEDDLQLVLQVEPEDLNQLYVYEAKMSMFLRLSQSKQGAEKLLHAGLMKILTESTYLDSRPENNTSSSDGFLPAATQRYHQLLLAALQVVSAISATLGSSHKSTIIQVQNFLEYHKDTLNLVLKSDADILSDAILEEICMIIKLCTQVLQFVEQSGDVIGNAINVLNPSILTLTTEYLSHLDDDLGSSSVSNEMLNILHISLLTYIELFCDVFDDYKKFLQPSLSPRVIVKFSDSVTKLSIGDILQDIKDLSNQVNNSLLYSNLLDTSQASKL